MQCPSCSSYSLKPTKLQYGLSARQCLKCHGVLVDLLGYRKWAEDFSQIKGSGARKLKEVEDNTKALVCPKCSRIMLKFKVSGDADNRVDVCAGCDEAWLDDGEWELLESLALQDKLNKIFTEPWQRNIKEEHAEISHEKRFLELLGDSEYKKLKDIKIWFDSHSKKADLIRFLLRK